MDNGVNIQGDAARQAISSLKGYAYQLYESALAWVSLSEDEFLFLEVAEDYAIATVEALRAVQVKTASAAVTLKSKEVIETINSFFELSRGNPSKSISIKHLTTAKIGLERKTSDRIDGRSGLEYWIAVQAGSDVEPLRQRLLELQLSTNAVQFLETSSPQQIKDGLISRIEWLTGAKEVSSLRQSLRNRLVYLGEKRNVVSSLCDAMVDPLISRVLTLASSEGSRRVERADFIRFFDEASRVSLPVSVIESMMRAINPSSPSHGFVSTVALLRPVASIDPSEFAVRAEVYATVHRSIDRLSFAWLYGATGTGKSSLSKLSPKRWTRMASVTIAIHGCPRNGRGSL